MKILILILMCTFCNICNASDTALYSCKYRYLSQKDSTNPKSKFEDIMILSVFKSSTIYYSYLKQLGIRNFEKEIQKKSENISEIDGVVNLTRYSGSSTNYYNKNESEIIEIDYNKKWLKVMDRLISTEFTYTESLNTPVWKIGNSIDTILGQKCQTATTYFKGREYTALFTTSIPIQYGPWLFNGLPGLILKVVDSKGQFLFECIELNTPPKTIEIYKPYANIITVSKKKLKANKKLLQTNPFAYIQSVEGKSITTKDAQGTIITTIKANKPYNPIDLSNK